MCINIKKTTRYRAFLILWISVTLACTAKNQEAIIPEPKGELLDTVSLIADTGFKQGLVLARTNEPSGGVLYPFKPVTAEPIWKIAEWGTKYHLSDQNRNETEESVAYSNEGKSLVFQKLNTGIGLKLKVVASREYDKPRVYNQSWPHLLIEQEFPNKPFLKNLKGLRLTIKGKLNLDERKMSDAEYDPSLHAAQFQLFITVQNRNPKSAYYGDYLWFGVPFYDNRNEIIPSYAAQDIAKGDATGKFIYSLGTNDFMKGTFHDKKWIDIEKDLYQNIIQALELAKKKGYLTGSFFEEFQLSGMNIGWEVPGTFDVEFEFKDFDIEAIFKK